MKTIFLEVASFTRAPAWLHEILSTFAQRGINRPDDPELLTAIYRASRVALDPAATIRVANLWFTHCINPSVNFPNRFCHPDPVYQGFWVLTDRQKRVLIDQLSYEAHGITYEFTNGPSQHVGALQRAAAAVRNDILVQPRALADIFDIPLEQAKQIKNAVLRVFTQPAWFLDVILSTRNGPVDPENPLLLAAIEREQTIRKTRIKGAIPEAIRVWKALVVDRIHRGEIRPLPYMRYIARVNGEEEERVVIRGSLIQRFFNDGN